jgi:hypothetical protein
MPLNSAMWIMTVAEVALWTVLLFVFRGKNLHKRFPAIGSYLLLRAISAPILLGLLFVQAQYQTKLWYSAYFFTYWAVYLASTVLLYSISLEIFRSALAGFSGLVRLGTIIFRWAAVVSVIITLSTISVQHMDVLHGKSSLVYCFLPLAAYQLMHYVSIIELCLLAFLCFSMNALRLSVRDLSFGIALGFGILSSSDFVLSAVLAHNSHTTLTDPIQFISEGILLFALCLWITYAALPEPERKPIVVPASSTIYRWNEIASALGHKSPKVAVPQPASASFFLTDVEKVVEKVITRTLTESESNS